MRFRTFILVTAAVAGVSLSLSGQQAAYVLSLQPGYNAISNPLDVGSNSVDELFPVMPSGSALAKFNHAGGSWELNNFDDALGHWEFNTGFIGTLQPGEGAFLYVPTAVQLTISGERHFATKPPNVGPGFNLVGCGTLEACRFDQLMGFNARVGDVLYQYALPLSDPTNPMQGASSVHHYGSNGWDIVPLVQPLHGAFINVASQPRVVINPPRLQVPAGGTARFDAQIIGPETGSFQWLFNGTTLGGATNPFLVITNVQAPVTGVYSVVAQFASGSVTSLNARLSLAFPPSITLPPSSLTATQGGSAAFVAFAAGSMPLYYQWLRAGTSAPQSAGVDRTNFVIPNVPVTAAGNYQLVVTNFGGSVTSAVFALNVLIPPQIFAQPQGQLAAPNDTVTLAVGATGTQPLQYQWMLNGNFIPGATGPSLTLNSIRPEHSGVYRVVIANAAGAVVSAEAIVRVTGGNAVLSDFYPGTAAISAPNGFLQSANFGATNQPGEPRHAGKIGGSSVWVNYSSPVAGIITFATRGSSFDTLLAAYTGTNLATFSEVASDDDRGGYLSSLISFSVQPNVMYHIAIDGLAAMEGRIVLNWSFEPTLDRLPVITLQPRNQVAVPGGTATFSVGTQGPVDGFQWFFDGSPIPGATQPDLSITNAQISNVGAYFVRVRIGTRVTDSRLADLELRDIDGNGQPPSLRAYDKFEDLLAALAGDPPGARFVPAAQVLGFTGSEVFGTAGSGGQSGEPIHCGVIGGHSKWYAYIPPASGRLFLNTDGSNFDTLLAAYTGCCTFATLTPVACDNNSGTNGVTSSIQFNASSNTIYFIAVDGVGGATGAAKLNYRLLVPMMLTNLASTTNSLTFRLNATPSWPFSVQRSTNFINWTNFLNGTSISGLFLFTDTNLPPGRRFYRSMQQP